MARPTSTPGFLHYFVLFFILLISYWGYQRYQLLQYQKRWGPGHYPDALPHYEPGESPQVNRSTDTPGRLEFDHQLRQQKLHPDQYPLPSLPDHF
jgi:hypothetical protein